MSEIEANKPNENTAITNFNPMQDVFTPDNDWLTGLRIKSPSSAKLQGEIGDWVFGNDRPLGKEIKVVVGPWRFAARRFEGETMGLQAFNRTKDAKFQFNEQSGLYEWKFPRYSKDWLEIKNKVKPDNGTKCRNLTGIDIMLWLPDIEQWCFYFVSGAAKNPKMTDVGPTLMRNPHKTFVLVTKKGPGSFHYYIPIIKSKLTETTPLPSDFDRQAEKFIDVPIELDGSEDADDSTTVER